MTSIYPKISSARLINENDYTIIDECVQMNVTCYFVEVDILIPEDLCFIPISIKNKEGLAIFCHGLIKNVVINHCDYGELLRFGI